ncbi:MAG: DUF2267 domain-containing protein [Steroidobacteraceae bacterium]
MQMYEFVGHVQHGARLPTMNQALNATRATLETLAERLGAEDSRQLAAQLPVGIGQYLDVRAAVGENFSSDEFLKRICAREGVDPPDSVCHTRAVLDTLQQAVSTGENRDLLRRLPSDYARLFTDTTGRPRRYGAGF